MALSRTVALDQYELATRAKPVDGGLPHKCEPGIRALSLWGAAINPIAPQCYLCEHEPEFDTIEQFQHHMLDEYQNMWKRFECGEQCKDPDKLYAHLHNQHPITLCPILVCPVLGCKRGCVNPTFLEFHTTVEHGTGVWVCKRDGCGAIPKTFSQLRHHQERHNLLDKHGKEACGLGGCAIESVPTDRKFEAHKCCHWKCRGCGEILQIFELGVTKVSVRHRQRQNNIALWKNHLAICEQKPAFTDPLGREAFEWAYMPEVPRLECNIDDCGWTHPRARARFIFEEHFKGLDR